MKSVACSNSLKALPRVAHLACWCCLCASSIGLRSSASGSEFTIDPTQTYFTLSGTVNGPSGVRTFDPQTPGSLTTNYSGELIVDLSNAGVIQFDGSNMVGIPHPGVFQPGGGPADFAIVANNFVGSTPGYGAIRNTTAYVSSPALVLDPSGNFNGAAVSVMLSSGQFDVAVAGLGEASAAINPVFQNDLAIPATLTAVGDQYRIDIPFHATLPTTLAGYASTLAVTGEIVAYRPIAHATAPSVQNGGFEAEVLGGPHDNFIQGWSIIPASGPNNMAGTMPSFPGMLPPASQGKNSAYINVQDGSTGLYQLVVPAGKLEANTLYTIQFDLGNRDVTDNGNLPNNAMDPFISVQGFFTLGADGPDFLKHVGAPFVLSHLSDAPEGSYLLNRSFVLDTSTLTAEQLAQGLNVVFLATSTTSINRGQVDIDNVRLTVVPEPQAFWTGMAGASCLIAFVKRLRRQPNTRGRPKTSRAFSFLGREQVGRRVVLFVQCARLVDLTTVNRRLCLRSLVAVPCTLLRLTN